MQAQVEKAIYLLMSKIIDGVPAVNGGYIQLPVEQEAELYLRRAGGVADAALAAATHEHVSSVIAPKTSKTVKDIFFRIFLGQIPLIGTAGAIFSAQFEAVWKYLRFVSLAACIFGHDIHDENTQCRIVLFLIDEKVRPRKSFTGEPDPNSDNSAMNGVKKTRDRKSSADSGSSNINESSKSTVGLSDGEVLNLDDESTPLLQPISLKKSNFKTKHDEVIARNKQDISSLQIVDPPKKPKTYSPVVKDIQEGTVKYAATVVVQKVALDLSVHSIASSFFLRYALGGVLAGIMPSVVNYIYFSFLDEYRQMGVGVQSQIGIITKRLHKRLQLHFKLEILPTLSISYLSFSGLVIAQIIRFLLQANIFALSLMSLKSVQPGKGYHIELVFLALFVEILILFASIAYMAGYQLSMFLFWSDLRYDFLEPEYIKIRLKRVMKKLPEQYISSIILLLKGLLSVLAVKGTIEAWRFFLRTGDFYHFHRGIIGALSLFIQYCRVHEDWLSEQSKRYELQIPRLIMIIDQSIAPNLTLLHCSLLVWSALEFVVTLGGFIGYSVGAFKADYSDWDSGNASRYRLSLVVDTFGVIGTVCLNILLEELRKLEVLLALFGPVNFVKGVWQAAKSVTYNLAREPKLLNWLDDHSPPYLLTEVIFSIQSSYFVIGTLLALSTEGLGKHWHASLLSLNFDFIKMFQDIILIPLVYLQSLLSSSSILFPFEFFGEMLFEATLIFLNSFNIYIAILLSVIIISYMPSVYRDEPLSKPFEDLTYGEALHRRTRLLYLLPDIKSEYRQQALKVISKFEKYEETYNSYIESVTNLQKQTYLAFIPVVQRVNRLTQHMQFSFLETLRANLALGAHVNVNQLDNQNRAVGRLGFSMFFSRRRGQIQNVLSNAANWLREVARRRNTLALEDKKDVDLKKESKDQSAIGSTSTRISAVRSFFANRFQRAPNASSSPTVVKLLEATDTTSEVEKKFERNSNSPEKAASKEKLAFKTWMPIQMPIALHADALADEEIEQVLLKNILDGLVEKVEIQIKKDELTLSRQRRNSSSASTYSGSANSVRGFFIRSKSSKPISPSQPMSIRVTISDTEPISTSPVASPTGKSSAQIGSVETYPVNN